MVILGGVHVPSHFFSHFPAHFFHISHFLVCWIYIFGTCLAHFELILDSESYIGYGRHNTTTTTTPATTATTTTTTTATTATTYCRPAFQDDTTLEARNCEKQALHLAVPSPKQNLRTLKSEVIESLKKLRCARQPQTRTQLQVLRTPH